MNFCSLTFRPEFRSLNRAAPCDIHRDRAHPVNLARSAAPGVATRFPGRDSIHGKPSAGEWARTTIRELDRRSFARHRAARDPPSACAMNRCRGGEAAPLTECHPADRASFDSPTSCPLYRDGSSYRDKHGESRRSRSTAGMLFSRGMASGRDRRRLQQIRWLPGQRSPEQHDHL